jgi:hypothetical protein
MNARFQWMRGFDVGQEGDPYLDRLRIIQTPWLGIYLHHIHRPDAEDCGHDHPWAFLSVILDGGYYELLNPDKHATVCKVRYRRRGSIHFMPLRSAHRITDIDGTLWSLVITGPRRAHWGFYPSGEFVPWEKYLNIEPAVTTGT